MSNSREGKITFVPLGTDTIEEHTCKKKKKFASVLESLYWQTIGWVHTPPFLKVDLPSDFKIKTPKSAVKRVQSQLYTKKSLEPKLQIEDRVPYGVLPKDVVIDIERKRFAQQDFKSILRDMDIETAAILPLTIVYKEKVVILKRKCLDGIPQAPFLELDIFDDALYYDAYSPEKWLSLGDTEKGRKPVPALAFLPKNENADELPNFDWLKVIVLDYDVDKKLYLVRMGQHFEEEIDSLNAVNNPSDMWIPRIYLKFDAEEPFQFAKRLQTALLTRHTIEESLRMSYYVECMPLEGAPTWPQSDLDAITATVRRSCQLQPKLQWIKDNLENITKEITIEYQRAYNFVSYMEIVKQSPTLVNDFKNIDLSFGKIHNRGSKVKLDYPFEERFESFRCKTFYTSVEVVRALNFVETNILALRDMSLYNLSSNDIYTLDNFEALQTDELQSIAKYINQNWMSNISDAILLNLEKCQKGPYDLNQTDLYTFKLTKLGRLLKMIMFKMQDVIRFLVMESLEKYATAFQEACMSVIDIKDDYVWEDSLSSDKLSPRKNPIFEVQLEIKGDHLQFMIDLKKYGEIAKYFFQEGLGVTKNLPRLEKFVLKKMLYNPDDELDSVGEKEKQVVRWKMDIIRGMDRAMIAATAYIRAYEEPLKLFKTDQINYVKQFARTKANCDQLKEVIEMHNNEKKKLENTIPSFIDIGPFRLITKYVRVAAIKKHQQLADAVLGHFYTKLTQFMESIKDQFLVLHDRIKQPTGNIEDLLDKKQWCRTVPKKIEKLSAEVNRLRSDFRLISTFHHNMDDEDFNTFWQVQEFPQMSMMLLQNRISTFDAERNEHKEHLMSDQKQLIVNIEQLQEAVASFVYYSNVDKASTIATEVRRARKNTSKCDEQSQLYQKREKLLGLPITEYEEIPEISDALVPYENFWLSAAEFQKYKERDLLTIEPTQLRNTIEDFYANLKKSLNYFTPTTHSTIHKSVTFVLKDIEEFMKTRLP